MVSVAGSRWLAGVTLAYCLGGAGAFIEESADCDVSASLEDDLVLESFLFQRGVRGHSSASARRHGGADGQLPQWSRGAPAARAQLLGPPPRRARGTAVSEAYSDYPGESVVDWISRRVGIEAYERSAQELRSRGTASGVLRSSERRAQDWSPCLLGAELPCSFWAEAYSCATTWSQACPGVDNPAGSQYNDAEIGAACPNQCGKAAGAPALEPPPAAAGAGGQSQLYPALCNLTKLASCSMWASAYPSCAVTWAEACPGVDNPSGPEYNGMTVQQSCPRQCAEKAAAKDCIGSANGATDAGDYDCKLGYTLPNYCGFYDDSDFTAEEMCCECGGGGLPDRGPRGATQPDQPEEPEEAPHSALPPSPPAPPAPPAQAAPPPAPPAALAVPSAASAALLARAAAGDQRLLVSSTAAFATGDMVTVAGGAASETVTIYLADSEPLYLQVKAGLHGAYPVGSIVTEKVPAQTYWCHDQLQFDCGVWAASFPCTYSYSVVCPGRDSPYGSALNGVALSTMCPSECGLPKATASSTATTSAATTPAAPPTTTAAEATTAAPPTTAETTAAGAQLGPPQTSPERAVWATPLPAVAPEADATADVPDAAVPEQEAGSSRAAGVPAQWAWISNFRMAHGTPLPSAGDAGHAVYLGTAGSHAEAEGLAQASSQGPFVAVNWRRPGAAEDSSADGAVYGLTTQDGWQGEGDQVHDTALRVDPAPSRGAQLLSTGSRGSRADKKAPNLSTVLELSGGQEEPAQPAGQAEGDAARARGAVLDFDSADQEHSARARPGRHPAAKAEEAGDAEEASGEEEEKAEAAGGEETVAAEEASGEASRTAEEDSGKEEREGLEGEAQEGDSSPRGARRVERRRSRAEEREEVVDEVRADRVKEDSATEEAAMQVAALAEAVIVDVDSAERVNGTAKGKVNQGADETVSEVADEAGERADEPANEGGDEKADGEGEDAAKDDSDAKESEGSEDDQEDVAGKRAALASVADVERLEAQVEFLTEQIKSLDDSVDRFFTRVQKRATFFKDQAVARSRRNCVPDKEKLSTFEFDITNAMNATFKDWGAVLRAFDAFGRQLRSLEGFEGSDRASFQGQASELAEELQLMTPEDSEHCNFRTLHKNVLSLSKAPLSLASVKLTQFRQAFFGCQELIDADLDQFFGALQAFAGRLSGAGEAVPDVPARLTRRAGEIIRGLNDEAVTLSFKIHDAFFQFSQVVERAVDGARPTMKRCGSPHHRK